MSTRTTGTLLICPRCGACVELLRERLSVDYVAIHQDAYVCDDCCAPLQLADDEFAAPAAHASVPDAAQPAQRARGLAGGTRARSARQ